MASSMSLKWEDQAYSGDIMDEAYRDAFCNDVFDVYESETNLYEREPAYGRKPNF